MDGISAVLLVLLFMCAVFGLAVVRAAEAMRQMDRDIQQAVDACSDACGPRTYQAGR